MEQVLVATGNEHKFSEMAAELDAVVEQVVSLAEKGARLERPESGDTYRENARIKAEEAFQKTGIPSLADDSGLEVDALDGGPGLFSDRWIGASATAAERNRHLLDQLDGVPSERRGAQFVCEMVLFDDSGTRFATRGVCRGRIATEPRGEGGFGYDPVFEVKKADWNTFGVLPGSVKNWISHRARALNEMISLLKTLP